MENTTRNIVVTVLAIIGAVAILAALGMWLMHSTMMGGAGGMSCCSVMGVSWLIGLLVVGGAAIVVAYLLSRRRMRL